MLQSLQTHRFARVRATLRRAPSLQNSLRLLVVVVASSTTSFSAPWQQQQQQQGQQQQQKRMQQHFEFYQTVRAAMTDDMFTPLHYTSWHVTRQPFVSSYIAGKSCALFPIFPMLRCCTEFKGAAPLSAVLQAKEPTINLNVCSNALIPAAAAVQVLITDDILSNCCCTSAFALPFSTDTC
jgi:hypothetical protein